MAIIVIEVDDRESNDIAEYFIDAINVKGIKKHTVIAYDVGNLKEYVMTISLIMINIEDTHDVIDLT